MSIHRHAAKRDANEPTIRKRFAHHGWHTEQLSGTGMPDLNVWPKVNGRGGWRICLLVDVKMPKGKVTPEQVKKWTELHAKGIPVYVARTEADVDALVEGTLEPWESESVLAQRARDAVHEFERKRKTKTGRYSFTLAADAYTPPRSAPVDAAKEADETFAPTLCDCIGGRHSVACMQRGWMP